MPTETHCPEPPRALGCFQGSIRMLQAGLVKLPVGRSCVSPDLFSFSDPNLHLSTLWHNRASLLQVGKLRHRCATSGWLSGRAESSLLWAECFLQAPGAGCSSLPHPAQTCQPCSSRSTGASHFLSKCPEMLVTQEMFVQL